MSSNEKLNNSADRLIYVDILRIISIFGVILIHVAVQNYFSTPVTLKNWQFMNIYHDLPRCSIIFVMISGIFHLRPNKKDLSFKEEMSVIFKKIFRMLTALIFWSFLCNIGLILVNKEAVNVHSISIIFEKIIFGPSFYHLWFLYMLIGLYLLTPIFRCFISNCKREHIEYFLILFFIIGTCFPLINTILKYSPVFTGKQIFFPAAEVTGYVGYYIAGYYFAHYKINNKLRIVIYILAVISILFTTLGTSFMSLKQNGVNTALLSHFLPNTMFATFGVFLLIQQLYGGKVFSDRMRSIIMNVSKNIFGIYLMHVIFIGIFKAIGVNMFIMTPLLSIPLIALAVMIVSYFGTVFISKIPVLNKYVL